MSQTPHRSDLRALEREQREPEEDQNPWPKAVYLFFGLMIGWGATYTAFQSGDGLLLGGDRRSPQEESGGGAAVSAGGAAPAVDGAQVYQKVCMACHQAQGEGLPGVFPPLAGSEWVLGSAEIPAKIILKGLEGPITVKGQTYQGVMPPFGEQLSDAEIAAVVSHVRSSWGNSAPPIKTEEVSALRETLKERQLPWQAEELK